MNDCSRSNFLRGSGALAAAALCGCGRKLGESVAVGSKEFTEELLLGEMYAQLLENDGMHVRRRLGLGGTQVAMAALRRGSIDLYPEYTGTALLVELKQPVIHDEERLYATVREAYLKRFDLTWLDEAPMNDTQAVATTAAVAAREHLTTISDLAAAAPRLRMGAIPEFLSREDGLPGLRRAYGGFHFKDVKLLDIGLKYRALENGDVDAVVAFATDGRIASDHLVVLRDDKRFWPAYHVAPVVRNDALQRRPRIAHVLNALAPHLDDATMRALNAEVDGEKREVADVAKSFLRRSGLLGANA